jgi:hypothetical protein
MKTETSIARTACPKAKAMLLRTACAARLALVPVLFALPAAVPAQFVYTTNSGAITITGYTGSGGAVTIPGMINGLPVTGIGEDAFYDCASLTGATIPNSVTSIGNTAFEACLNLASVTIPNSVTNIGYEAFGDCYSLASAYFEGNAPAVDLSMFSGDTYLTFYYLPGATGWGAFFDNRPAVLWNPSVLAGSFGVRTNQFGFTVAGSPGLVVVVEASTNLAHPTWSPLATNTLTSGSFFFSDARWTNYPARFYRLHWP